MICKPLVSVIIPFYNSESSIVATLESVVAQTYKNIEVILINDGSTDASLEKVKLFISHAENKSFELLEQENKGVSAARNLGLKKAKGDFIAFLDSDDQWDPQKTEIQLDCFLKNPEIDLLATNRNGEKYKHFFGFRFANLTSISPRLLLYKNFLLTPTVLFKREILNRIGSFNENLNYAEDYEFFLRCAQKYNCFLLNKSLVFTGYGKPSFGHSGLSANLWKMEKGELETIKLGYKLGVVGFFEYIFLCCYSLIKYLRRMFITKLR